MKRRQPDPKSRTNVAQPTHSHIHTFSMVSSSLLSRSHPLSQLVHSARCVWVCEYAKYWINGNLLCVNFECILHIYILFEFSVGFSICVGWSRIPSGILVYVQMICGNTPLPDSICLGLGKVAFQSKSMELKNVFLLILCCCSFLFYIHTSLVHSSLADGAKEHANRFYSVWYTSIHIWVVVCCGIKCDRSFVSNKNFTTGRWSLIARTSNIHFPVSSVHT